MAGTMSKLTLAGFILPFLLLFTSFETRSGNPATKESPNNQLQSAPLQKMIVQNGRVSAWASRADDPAEANSGHRAPVANGVPRPDHVVIVIEENHSYSEIIGSSAAPYINSLAVQGALFTQSYAIRTPASLTTSTSSPASIRA
jgi:hypothetical protein